MLLSAERPKRGSLCTWAFRGHAAALQWSGASSPAGVGWEHVQTDNCGSPGTWESPTLLLGNIPAGDAGLPTPGSDSAHSSGRERTQRVHPRYRQAKETKCGEMAVGCGRALIVPLKVGNSPWRTQWRKAKRRPADSIEGNMRSTSRFTRMSTSLGWIASGTYGMAKLLVEEPDALGHVRICGSPVVVTPGATQP